MSFKIITTKEQKRALAAYLKSEDPELLEFLMAAGQAFGEMPRIEIDHKKLNNFLDETETS